MKDSEILQAIADHIIHYRDAGNTMSIPDLLDLRDQIATYCWNLAETAGDAKTDWNQCYYMRKISVSRTKQASIINKKVTATIAELDSIIENEGLFKAEILKEGYAFKLDLLLKQANKVIDAISQRISYAKIEESQSRFQNQT